MQYFVTRYVMSYDKQLFQPTYGCKIDEKVYPTISFVRGVPLGVYEIRDKTPSPL